MKDIDMVVVGMGVHGLTAIEAVMLTAQKKNMNVLIVDEAIHIPIRNIELPVMEIERDFKPRHRSGRKYNHKKW